jgi:hypothetical protein
MMSRRVPFAVLLLVATAAGRAPAQDSQLGIQGLGTPQRWESVRARSTGGAFAAFDAASPLADAALASLQRLTAYGGVATSARRVEGAGAAVSLRSTLFPGVTVAGPLGRFVVGGGFAPYLQRSYSIERPDTIMLRGVPVAYTDELGSKGGVGDVRFAAVLRAGDKAALGASLHFLTGLARQTLVRRFDDSVTYGNTRQVDDIRFNGLGGAASVLLRPGGGLQLAGWVRADTRLEYETPDSTGRYDLPIAAGAALAWHPRPRIALAVAVDWRGWSVAGVNSFDVRSWSVGAELGDPTKPLRLGVRGGELPFGPGGEPATELGLSAGVGLRFSDGRAVIDVGVERLMRSAPGLDEGVWTALFGITVRP